MSPTQSCTVLSSKDTHVTHTHTAPPIHCIADRLDVTEQAGVDCSPCDAAARGDSWPARWHGAPHDLAHDLMKFLQWSTLKMFGTCKLWWPHAAVSTTSRGGAAGRGLWVAASRPDHCQLWLLRHAGQLHPSVQYSTRTRAARRGNPAHRSRPSEPEEHHLCPRAGRSGRDRWPEPCRAPWCTGGAGNEAVGRRAGSAPLIPGLRWTAAGVGTDVMWGHRSDQYHLSPQRYLTPLDPCICTRDESVMYTAHCGPAAAKHHGEYSDVSCSLGGYGVIKCS